MYIVSQEWHCDLMRCAVP